MSHSGEVGLAHSLPLHTPQWEVTALSGSLSSVLAGAHSLSTQRFLIDDPSGRTGHKRGKCLPTPPSTSFLPRWDPLAECHAEVGISLLVSCRSSPRDPALASSTALGVLP